MTLSTICTVHNLQNLYYIVQEVVGTQVKTYPTALLIFINDVYEYLRTYTFYIYIGTDIAPIFWLLSRQDNVEVATLGHTYKLEKEYYRMIGLPDIM